VSVTSANSVTWSIAGAPSGMTINSATGLVSWPNPVAGTTQITVTATDTLNGLSGSGTVTLSIAAPQTPGTVSTHTKTVAGNAGVPLLIGVPGLRFNVESYTLDSIKLPDGGTVIPSDLTVNPMLGWIQWNNPVQGKTTLTLTARDAAQKAVVSWVITLNINGPLVGPTISTTPITGNVGTALRSLVRISANPNDANVYLIDISVTGAPAGMRLYGTSQGLAVKWANPVAGTYVLGITATDDTPNHGGKSTQANVTLTIQ
jgi:hypothetical protein